MLDSMYSSTREERVRVAGFSLVTIVHFCPSAHDSPSESAKDSTH